MSFEEAKIFFKLAGAIYYKVYSVSYIYKLSYDTEPFCCHFFNEDGHEIGYYHYVLKSYHVFDEPRVWSVEFLNNKSYSNQIAL